MIPINKKHPKLLNLEYLIHHHCSGLINTIWWKTKRINMEIRYLA
jgi:hypothetical protein